MPRPSGFTALLGRRGFIPTAWQELRELQLLGLLVHGLPTTHGRFALLSVWPFALRRSEPTRSSPLLWPLLTSRAGPLSNAPSPFQALGEISPGKTIDCPCTSAGFTEPPLGRKSFAVSCPLALRDSASYPVSVRRPTGLAPRCFQRVSHDSRLAVRSDRCDQLSRGLSPPGRCSCWAHTRKGRPKAAPFRSSQFRFALLRPLPRERIEAARRMSIMRHAGVTRCHGWRG